MATTLEEALRQGKVKIGDYIDYKPISGRYVLTREQTGWEEDQVFETEDLGWRLDNIGGISVLIASKPTKGLYLKGKAGYENGIDAMKTLCESCYFNPRFSQEIVPITEELQLKMSRQHIIKAEYWLGSTVFYPGTWTPGYGIGYVDERGNFKSLYLYYSCGVTEYGCFGVLPIVYLRSNIQLNGGSGRYNDPWEFLIQRGRDYKVDEQVLDNLSLKEIDKLLSAVTKKLMNYPIQDEKLKSLKNISEELKQILDSMQ